MLNFVYPVQFGEQITIIADKAGYKHNETFYWRHLIINQFY